MHNIEFSCPAASAQPCRNCQAAFTDQHGLLGDNCNDYYDARQAGIFDSSCAPLFLVQSLSFFWYSSSSLHR